MALFYLGMAYQFGIGVTRDLVQAYAWYNVAAAKGDEAAPRSRTEVAQQMSSSQLEAGQRLSREYGNGVVGAYNRKGQGHVETRAMTALKAIHFT